jgi:hypothetical protein
MNHINIILYFFLIIYIFLNMNVKSNQIKFGKKTYELHQFNKMNN